MKRLLTLFAGAMLFAACQKNDLQNVEQELMTPLDRAQQSQLESTHRFIIKTSGNTNLAQLQKSIADAGGQMTGSEEKLNMYFVATQDMDFASKFKHGGASLAADLETYLPEVKPTAFLNNPEISTGYSNPWFNYLWGLDAVEAPQAWNSGYSGKGVKVAVVDGGFYINHPDLAANLLVDEGRNFVNWDDINPIYCQLLAECNPRDVRYKSPSSPFSHATHVAGTIAAVDNNIGVIGVAYEAKILPLKALSDFTGSGYVSWIVNAIVYAADNGADVINLSLGGIRIKGDGKGSNITQEGIKMYNEAIQYATQKGALVVVASGNNGLNVDRPVQFTDGSVTGSLTFYPAASPDALTVGATAPYDFIRTFPNTYVDHFATYSNHGKSLLDVVAPGGDLQLPETDPYIYYDAVLSTSGPASYYFSTGTSMAAPHVSGVAALVIEKTGGQMSPSQVKNILIKTADKVGGSNGKTAQFGHGRVNAFKAVQ